MIDDDMKCNDGQQCPSITFGVGETMMRRVFAVGLLAGLALLISACESDGIYHESAGDCLFFNGLSEVSAVSMFPWVPNESSLDAQGPFHGNVTIQNLEADTIEVDILVGVGTSGENWDIAGTIDLKPYESQTLSASTLDIPGEGGSVMALGYLDRGEYDDDSEQCLEDAEFARIAGLTKSMGPVPGASPATTAAHETVDGYSGLRIDQVATDWDAVSETPFPFSESASLESIGTGRQSDFVLPIVQTNSGWDTTIRVANMNPDGNSLANATVTLYESGGQGFAGPSEVINLQIRPGGVENIVLSDYIGAGWVGSAYIESSAYIGAIAERHKAETNMLLSNVSRPITEPAMTDLFAPLVFKEYNFWNTGISVANTDQGSWNTVTITYYGPSMNQVGQDTLTIPPRGMEYIFTPGTQSLGLNSGFVGSARISGSQPLHVAVDQVKYFGSDDPDIGQAMSYVVDPYQATAGTILAMPLIQKGSPRTGTGDTSGVQLFNPTADGGVDVEITFYGANGNPVAPTVENNMADPIQVSLAANQSYTLYTNNLTEMSSGMLGSMILEVTGGDGSVVGVSNNVNYDVQYDGSAAFNLVGALGVDDEFAEILRCVEALGPEPTFEEILSCFGFIGFE